MQGGNNYPGQMHPNQLQHQNFKQPFQQQQQQQFNMHHQNYHPNQPQQQHQLPQQQQIKKPYQNNEYSLDLNPTPRVNSPQNHQAQSPYAHVNSPK